MRRRLLGAAAVITLAGACASNPPVPVVTTPKYPAYAFPEIPAALHVTPDVRDRYQVAWQRLQAGDLGGASRDLAAIEKTHPGFYPAEAALGWVGVAGHQFKAAGGHFGAALAVNDRYLPAWLGQVDAALGQGDDPTAIAAMERVLAIDPTRTVVKSRLELVRFRDVQAEIDAGRRARSAGKFPDAIRDFEQALAMSPTSAAILDELATTEVASGALDDAESHARRAVDLDPTDPDEDVMLASVLEARGKFRDAAAALGKAVTLDPRSEWKAHIKVLRDKADLAALPANFSALPTAETFTRAEAAAFIGIKLRSLIDEAPHRVAPVATDVRNHWAAPWISALTETSIMEVYANHTFQPSAEVRRADLAQIGAALTALAAANRPADLARWRAARPKFPDVPATNLFYRSAALAVSAATMAADPDGRFQPMRPATGADLGSLVARIELLASH